MYTSSHPHTLTPSHPQSSLAQLGIPLTDVLKVLVAILLLGNILFYEAKNQELSMQGSEGTPIPSPLHTLYYFTPFAPLSLPLSLSLSSPLLLTHSPPLFLSPFSFPPFLHPSLSLPPRAAGSGEPPRCAAPAPPESTHSQNLPLW